MDIRVLACLVVCVMPVAADDVKDMKKPADADITRLLVGKWDCTDPTAGAAGTISYAKEGTFAGDGTVESRGEKIEVHIEGTWKVSGGAILATVSKSTRPGVVPIGIEVKEDVHAIDEKSMRFTRGLGKEKSRTRVKE